MITHQQQPDDLTCGPACVAMVLGAPVKEVVEIIRTFDGAFTAREMHAVLLRCKIPANLFAFPDLVAAGTYILTVPSLNHEGGLHWVVAEVGSYFNGWMQIHDPQRGREGKKFYGEGGVALKCWSEAIYVVCDWKSACLPDVPFCL